MDKPQPLPKEKPAVFVAIAEKKCSECAQELVRGEFFLPKPDNKLLCLACAELDELEFLPSGDPALTRRAGKYSKVSYLVLKFSKARKRFERQGMLVDPTAIDQAEKECVADQSVRQLRQARNQIRIQGLDQDYIKQFAAAIRQRYPQCPANRELLIAQHACQRHSGRVGRSAAAKEFEAKMIDLAVGAHIRHQETNYDEMLLGLMDRDTARELVWEKVQRVLARWRGIS